MITKSDNTGALADWVRILVPLYSIGSIFEIPCGDASWYGKMAGRTASYTGWDHRKTYVKANQKKFPDLSFAQHDAAEVFGYPTADLIIIRDLSRHPHDLLMAAIRSFGARYLVTLIDVAEAKGLSCLVATCAHAPELGLYDLHALRLSAYGVDQQEDKEGTP